MSDAPVTVKVHPYPIPAQIVEEASKTPAQPRILKILKLTTLGFIAETGPMTFKASERIEVTFRLPTDKMEIKGKVVVIKTYDHYEGKIRDKTKVRRVTEMHFLNLAPPAKSAIDKFLLAIQPR